jgi:hypothetical protein
MTSYNLLGMNSTIFLKYSLFDILLAHSSITFFIQSTMLVDIATFSCTFIQDHTILVVSEVRRIAGSLIEPTEPHPEESVSSHAKA